ncbi:hypothetical protein B0T17DRAFT_86265 [Bombardia bombarda]|uniref:Uncharacterized protein n=1 Tax=Bombardia bombarda TaxID=252184 RepID=A0AA40CF94_9PEZI|nr:hypothetical protein B0T17DRAFT_86265 [Bombardia bombarda]
MPRKPTTVISRLLYLCNSENLPADVRGSAPSQTTNGPKSVTGYYSFGWLQHSLDGGWFIGVERRSEYLAIQYRFGETEPSTESIQTWGWLEQERGMNSVMLRRIARDLCLKRLIGRVRGMMGKTEACV